MAANMTSYSHRRETANLEAPMESLEATTTSPKALTQAPSGRQYTLWKPSFEKHIKLMGALIPDGYELRSDSECPFVCPVRTCRVLFLTIQGIDLHFWRHHEAELFNDNLDGTLSFVGRRTGKGKIPAIVVSQEPLGSEDVDMREPTLPGEYTSKVTTAYDVPPISLTTTSNHSKELALPATSSMLASTSPHIPLCPRVLDIDGVSRRQGLWECIAPYLSTSTISSFNRSFFMHQLMKLPKLRDLVFEPQARDTFKVVMSYDMIALAVYLTGVESPHLCPRCLFKKGPFKGCILIHPEAPISLQMKLSSCANCLYKGHIDLCGLDACVIHGNQPSTDPHQLEEAQMQDEMSMAEPEQQAETQEDLPNHSSHALVHHDNPEPMVNGFSQLAVACYSASLENGKEKTSLTPASSSSIPTPERRSMRIVLKQTKATPIMPATPSSKKRKLSDPSPPKTPVTRSDQDHNDVDMDWAPTPATRRSNRLRSLSIAQSESTVVAQGLSCSTGNNNTKRNRREIHVSNQGASPGSPTATMTPSPPSTAIQYRSQDVFQLEDWELAPGRIRHGKHNVAFSTTYLRSNSAISVDPTMAFHVIVINAGSTHRLEANPAKVRLVSIAAGKIRTKMFDQDFIISTNGAVKVFSDTVCVFQNPFSIDATLHICTLQQS